MKIKLFNPNQALMESAGIEPVSYAYGRGVEIVKHFGNIFKVRLLPNIRYLIMSTGSEINVERPFICSNKYDYDEHPNLEPAYVEENSFRHMYLDKYLGGLPSNVHGKRCILTFPFSSDIPFVFDLEREELLPMLTPSFKDIEGLDEYYEKMEEFYGDCSDLFISSEGPAFKPLDVNPCGEYACTDQAEYLIAYGWQICELFSDKIKLKSSNRRVKYLVILVHRNGEDDEFIYSGKWAYENHTKVEDWMKEDGAHELMLKSTDYSGMPCNVNGRKTIVCYPFMVYNPVIWDVITDEVFVLPSKSYPGDEYYDMLVKKYGEFYSDKVDEDGEEQSHESEHVEEAAHEAAEEDSEESEAKEE